MVKLRDMLRDLWKKETLLLMYGVPTWLLAFIQIGLSFITIAFAGKVSENMLAGVGLGNTIYNVMLWSVLLGFTSSLDTFGPQLFASEKTKRHLGTITLKICLQGLLVYLLILGPYLNTIHIVRLLPSSDNRHSIYKNTSILHTPEHNTSSLDITVQYMRLICIVPLMDFLVSIVSKYFTIQRYIKTVYVISILMILLHFMFNFILVTYLKRGVAGLVLAAVLTRMVTIAMLGVFCFFKRKEMAWPGITVAINGALENWNESFQLGISGAVNMFVELGAFEIATFFSQFNGTTALATIVIMFQFIMIVYTIPYGIATASSILIGNAIGSGNKDLIRSYTRLTILNTIVEGVVLAILFYSCRKYLVLIFTKDQDLIDTFVGCCWIMLFQFPLDHLQTILSRGVLIAFGKQRFIAVTLALICYPVMLPLMITLIFKSNLGPLGVFISFLVFVVLNCIACAVRISFLNMDDEIAKSCKRTADITSCEKDAPDNTEERSSFQPSEITPLTSEKHGHGFKTSRSMVLSSFVFAVLLLVVLAYTSSIKHRTTIPPFKT